MTFRVSVLRSDPPPVRCSTSPTVLNSTRLIGYALVEPEFKTIPASFGFASTMRNKDENGIVAQSLPRGKQSAKRSVLV